MWDFSFISATAEGTGISHSHGAAAKEVRTHIGGGGYDGIAAVAVGGEEAPEEEEAWEGGSEKIGEKRIREKGRRERDFLGGAGAGRGVGRDRVKTSPASPPSLFLDLRRNSAMAIFFPVAD